MKFLPIIAAVAVFVAAPALATSDFDRCANKAPEVVAAIGEFCTSLGTKNVIPNPKGKAGHVAHYEGKKAQIYMQGAKCKDQWVPQQYCFSQYYWMCANGSKRGAKAQQYGKDKCQLWSIINN